jgi:hypothetical protein
MSCGTGSSFCLPGNQFGSNSSGGPSKTAKIYQDSIVGSNGPNRDFTFKLCDWSMQYSQFNQSNITIKAGTLNQILEWGQGVAFVALEVIFSAPSGEKNLSLKLSLADSNGVYCLAGLWVWQATELCVVPNIKLSNTTAYDATIKILTLAPNAFNSMPVTSQITNTSTFDDLVYKSVRTHNSTTIAIWSLNQGGNPNNYFDTSDMTTIVYLDISSITNIEIQGRFIIIDDSSLGKLYFGFVDEYTARQILSELTYLLNNISLHNVECLGGFTLPMPLDILGPVVNWTSSVINSTATLFLDGYNNIITYQDLINALISSIIDDRDGMITPNQNMITVIALQYQNQTLCPPEFIPNTINQLGIYTMTVSVTDIAGNNTTISITLNVTLSEDVQGPELIFNDNYIIDSQPYTIIYLDNYPI